MKRILCAGHICLDIIPELFQSLEFSAGALIDVGKPTLSTGGSVANTGLALHRLGAHVDLCGKIGDDGLGTLIQSVLQKEGATVDLSIDPATSTSYTVVLNPPGQDRMFLHHPGANHEFTSDDVTDDALQRADILHLGYPPLMRRLYLEDGAEVVKLFERAHRHGLLTSLDLALPDPDSEAGKVDWLRWLRAVLPHCDLFQPSATELRQMLGLEMATVEQLAEVSLDLGAEVVAIKNGDQGLYVQSETTLTNHHFPKTWAKETVRQPCLQVPVIGTTGAGDATVAGLLYGLAQGEDLPTACKMAVAVGARCVMAADALSGILPWPETQAWVATQGSRA